MVLNSGLSAAIRVDDCGFCALGLYAIDGLSDGFGVLCNACDWICD